MGFLETNISRRPVCRRMYYFNPTTPTFRRLFTVIYPCKQTHNITQTWCKLQDGWKPMQPAAIRSRIQLGWNVQVSCHACYFDLKLIIYSSGLPTSFRYILAQDFPLLFSIIISSLPPQQIMAPQTPQQGEHGTESSRTTGASSNMPPAETQLQRRHQLAHHDAANAATENRTLDTQLNTVHKTGSSKNKKLHMIGCEDCGIKVDERQLIIWHAAVECRELRDQFPAARNGEPPWSTKAFVHTVREIEHHDVVSSGMIAEEFSDKNPREWTKQALTTLEDAT